MKLLIESSTNFLILSIESGGKFKSFYREGKCDHSETLMDYLDSFLKNENFKYDEITDIFVGRGPGSYTGLRIAGVIGKVMAYSLNIKLHSFSSLEYILCNIKHDGKYLAVSPAKREAAYAKAIEIKNSEREIILDESFLEKEDLAKFDSYERLEISSTLLSKADDIFKTILEQNLYIEESVMDYAPNYLRSVI